MRESIVHHGSRSLIAWLRTLARHPIRLDPIWRAVQHRPEAFILGFGVLLRLAQYLANRSFWLDEASLAGNIGGKTLAELFGRLTGTQLAPPAFLAIERAAFRVLGGSPLALRLFPLLCGLASLPVFLAVARRALAPRNALMAFWLFAVSDDLIYFASELKQYETDLAVGLACTLAGIWAVGRRLRPSEVGALALVGVVAVWFSHPSAFVLAGVGSVLVVENALRSEWTGALMIALASLAWALSFAVVVAISREQLGHGDDMWVFWGFAFPPIPPRSLWDATWVLRRFLYFFVNPLDYHGALGSRILAIPPLIAWLTGFVSMARRDARRFTILVAPLGFTLAASVLRQYPFHGRLLLFLVPSFLILIAEGAVRFESTVRGRAGRAIVFATILLWPSLGAIHHLFEPRDRYDFNPHGDRRPARLSPIDFPLRDR